MMTALQYVNYTDNKPIGRIKYALIQFRQRVLTSFNMKKFFLLLINTCLSMQGFSQFLINGVEPFYDKATDSFLLSINEEQFGADFTASVSLKSGSEWETLTIDGQPVGEVFNFKEIKGDKSYLIGTQIKGEPKYFTLQFTFLPILKFSSGQFGYDYVNDKLVLQADGKVSEVKNVKVKWRGGTTNSEGKNKRNYKLKFVDDYGESKDQSFFNLRNDNDWILDAGQVDMFRMRNLIAAQIWQDFASKPYYTENEPKALSATRGNTVEVFLDNYYQGVFNLCEPIDRKQMKLKKFDENGTIHGGLWKAAAYGDATFWNIPKEYDNTKERNDVWELKYPEIDDLCPSDYSTLWNAIMFVATSSDIDFNNQIEEFFDMPVLIDYYLFVQLTNAFDICGKNIYWAVYDKEKSKKLTPAMWDLDCTMGQNYKDEPLHPDYVSSTYPLLIPNKIFYRLLQLNTNQFKEKVVQRYADLREDIFSTAALQGRYVNAYNTLSNSGASKREEQRWSYDTDISGLKLDLKNELEYICTWLEERMIFLDSEFSYDPTSITNINNSPIEEYHRSFTLQGTIPTLTYKGIVISNGKKMIRK